MSKNKPVTIHDISVDLGGQQDLVTMQLSWANAFTREHFTNIVALDDMTVTQFGLLVLIKCNPGISQVRIAAIIGNGKPSTGVAIKRLREKQWIERLRSPEDNRVLQLHLTANGRATLAKAWRRVKSHEDAVCADLSADERIQLLSLLRRVHRAY